MNFLKKIFSKKTKTWIDKEIDDFYLEKDKVMAEILGIQAPTVGHAIVGFAVGGAVDMYYYHFKNGGTIFATQELISPTGENQIPNRNGLYELVAFTKQEFTSLPIGEGKFGKLERRLCGIFTGIGNFSYQAKLEPGETCELPVDGEPNRCLIFDEYIGEDNFQIADKTYGFLLIIEVFRDELDFARSNGVDELKVKLKNAGHYPFSDLDRESVIK
jgi:hypothetical protein